MYRGLLLILIASTAACNMLAGPSATPTLTVTLPPSQTPTVSSTPTATATASITPSITPSPTMTMTPSATLPPTVTPTASHTPQPTASFVFDNLRLVDIPPNIADGLDGPLIAFVNQNDSITITNLSTAQPATGLQTLYFASPTNRASRTAILDLPAASGDQIYIAPRANAVAYFVSDPSTAVSGLYVLDVTAGVSQRILPLTSLAQRGLFSAPAWSPDGVQLAVTLETGYNLDIFLFNLNTNRWTNLTESGAYEMWPAWSPDGRYLAFVSDRVICPSWIPGQPNACNPAVDLSPNGGHVFILEMASGEITQLSDQWTTEPLQWINNRHLAFSGGDRFDVLGTTRTLWIADVAVGRAQEVRLAEDANTTPLYLSEVWSSDGSRVIFQRAGETSEIVVASLTGARLAQINELSFVRFGMAASWSPDGSRIVIGGSGGQCPYAAVVLEGENFTVVTRGSPPPTMCDPVYSPDGRFIAFAGINPARADGRVDIYVTNANGREGGSITADLRGQMILLGWVAP